MKMRMKTLSVAACAVLSVALTACSSSSGGAAPSSQISAGASGAQGSATSGAAGGEEVSLVYVPGGMPYFGLTKSGGLDGVDGDLLNAVTSKLNVRFKTNSAEFPAFLAGIQTHRYDIGIGGVAWTKERAATGLFTDPVYYSPIVMLCKQGVAPTTVAQLKGLSVGALTSDLQDTAIRAAPGVDAHTYPSSQLGLQDLISGRLACLSLDTLTVAFIHEQRPDLKSFGITAISAPSASEIKANPGLASFLPYMVAWYLAKGKEGLVTKLNTLIDSWYKSGFTAKVLTKWGVTDPASLLTAIPKFSTDRRGVDRPASWNAPTVGK